MSRLPRARSWCARLAALPLALVLLSPVALASFESGAVPLWDLRCLGRATAWTGCFESLDVDAVNPANLGKNILAFVGSPSNQRVEVSYEVEAPESLPAGTQLVAALEVRCVRREGWETAGALATVRGPDGARATRAELSLSGELQTWRIPVPSSGPGLYRISVRLGGVRYFTGEISKTVTLTPDVPEPQSREGWFASRLVEEKTQRSYSAVFVRGAEARPAVTSDFPTVASGAGNVIQWASDTVEPREYGVSWSVSVEPEEVGKPLAVGLLLRYPIGEGRVSIIDALEQTVVEVPVYPCPGVRAVWVPFTPTTAEAHVVRFLDSAVGKSDASIYALCYLRDAGESAPGFLRP